MRKWYALPAVALVAAGVVSVSLAMAASQGGPTVRTPEQLLFIPNAFSGTTMHFDPGTVAVASGGTVTFVNSQKDEPHTVTVVKKSELPRTVAQVNNCQACGISLGHLKDPRHPDTSPIKTYVLDKGEKGFDTRGDSLLITPGGPHKKAVVTVSAPAGTTLYYVCAVHPWMQGSIVVTS